MRLPRYSFAVIEKPRARGLIRANWRINQARENSGCVREVALVDR